MTVNALYNLINQIDSNLSNEEKIERIYAHILNEAIRLTSAIYGEVLLVSTKEDYLTVVASTIAEKRNQRIPKFSSQKPQLLDMNPYARANSELEKNVNIAYFRENSERSMLSIPIRAGEQILGVLNIESEQNYVFEHTMIADLVQLAGYAAFVHTETIDPQIHFIEDYLERRRFTAKELLILDEFYTMLYAYIMLFSSEPEYKSIVGMDDETQVIQGIEECLSSLDQNRKSFTAEYQAIIFRVKFDNADLAKKIILSRIAKIDDLIELDET